ncbi:hypothetical protein ACFCWT_13410 [Streptomyces olivaceus]|uniref:hypothetical protein n=1 Tax=Streptomyces olivaceus TaxID=47716 RepID=UPI0035D97BBE
MSYDTPLGYTLGVLYVLICLGMIAASAVLFVHLPSGREHGPDCRPCRLLRKLFGGRR